MIQSSIDPRLTEVDTCLYRVSVKAIIVNDGKLLLIKEEDDPFWSFPGGGIDYGESDETALIRELSEELGIAPDKIKITGNVAFVATGGILSGVPKLNLFYDVKVSPIGIKPTKYVQDHKWCSFEELPKLYISPSTGSVTEKLKKLLRGELEYRVWEDKGELPATLTNGLLNDILEKLKEVVEAES